MSRSEGTDFPKEELFSRSEPLPCLPTGVRRGPTPGTRIARSRSVLSLRLRRGVTVGQVLVLLSSLVILGVVGWVATRDVLPRSRMIRLSKNLQADLVALRRSAIDLRRQTRIVFLQADTRLDDASSPSVGAWSLEVGNRSAGSNAWDVLPLDGLTEAEDTRAWIDRRTARGFVEISAGGQDSVAGVSLAPWPPLAGPGHGNADAIVFAPDGSVENPPRDLTSEGTIRFSLVNKRAWAQEVDDRVVVTISRSGSVQVTATIQQRPDQSSEAP